MFSINIGNAVTPVLKASYLALQGLVYVDVPLNQTKTKQQQNGTGNVKCKRKRHKLHHV